MPAYFKQSEFKAMKKYHVSGWYKRLLDDRWIGLVNIG